MLILLQNEKDTALRTTGIKLREQILNEKPQSVIFDFTDINTVTNSFADELIAKLFILENRPQIKIINASNNIQAVIKTAIKNRTN